LLDRATRVERKLVYGWLRKFNPSKKKIPGTVKRAIPHTKDPRVPTLPYLTAINMRGGALQNFFKKRQ